MKIIVFIASALLLTSCQTTSNSSDMMIGNTPFETYDTNDDGFVTKNDLDNFYGEKFDLIDADSNESLSIVEFRQSLFAAEMKYHKSQNNVPELQPIMDKIDYGFIQLDANKDQKISRKEFMASSDKKAKFLDSFDSNNDKAVSKAEMKNVIDSKFQ